MSFDDLMKQMKESYQKELPLKLQELQELLAQQEQASSQNEVQELIKQLKNFFHKLKGSGSSYGFPEVTAYGKKFEDKILQQEEPESWKSEALNELQKIIN